MLNKSGKESTEAVAEIRASQILAEMLGILCHPQYYNAQQEQMVSYPPTSSLAAATNSVLGCRCAF